ncbi:MAG TPA: 30S ribosome-binding factor RbfA [Terriglobales bacterium]|nr:30S ribosome-binding factor RbfA [Terriglobales bacterium]
MENRAQQHHRERLSEAIREEISAMIEGELGDPRIGLVTVNEVHLAADGKSAQVMVAVTGDAKEQEQTLQGLKDATGYIRHELTDRLRLRHAPELFFRLDKSEQYESRIDELLKRIEKRK